MASRNSRRSGARKARPIAPAKQPPRRRLVAALGAEPAAVKDVMHCASQLARPVRQARKTYSATIIVLAMLAQTAGTLRSLIESGHLSRREAARYCREFGAYVLARDSSANGSNRRMQ